MLCWWDRPYTPSKNKILYRPNRLGVEKKRKQRLLLGWSVLFLWFILTVLIARWLFIPYIVSPVLGISDIASQARPFFIRMSAGYFSLAIVSVSLYFVFNHICKQFSEEKSLWNWFGKTFQDTINVFQGGSKK